MKKNWIDQPKQLTAVCLHFAGIDEVATAASTLGKFQIPIFFLIISTQHGPILIFFSIFF